MTNSLYIYVPLRSLLIIYLCQFVEIDTDSFNFTQYKILPCLLFKSKWKKNVTHYITCTLIWKHLVYIILYKEICMPYRYVLLVLLCICISTLPFPNIFHWQNVIPEFSILYTVIAKWFFSEKGEAHRVSFKWIRDKFVLHWNNFY